MIHARMLPLAAATVMVLACSGAQTKSPVVTNGPEGKSISPSGDAASKRGTSLVRFVNALPGSGNLNIVADQGDVFGNIGYKTVTTYHEMGDNVSKFSLRAAGNGADMATNSETMSDGFRYTIVALSDEKGGASLRVLRDELVPDAGKARIRVIHAAPGLKNVDVAVQGRKEPLFSGINYATEAGFKDVDPTTAVFEIRRDKGNTNLIRLPKMTLEAGKAYTIVITGTAPDKVTTITFDDAVTPGAPTVSLRTPN